MTRPEHPRRTVMSVRSRLPTWGRHQLLLRVLVGCLPPAALLLSHATPTEAPTWLVAAVLALATGWALFPESAAGATALVVVLCWWGYSFPTASTPLCIAASGMLYLAHSAATVTALGPARLDLDAAVLRLWSRRLAVTTAIVPVAYLCISAARASEREVPASWALSAVAAALAALVVASLLADPRAGGATARRGPRDRTP